MAPSSTRHTTTRSLASTAAAALAVEQDGLVSREVSREVPPKVEYSLTDEGRSLNQALRPLGEWGTSRAARLGEIGS